jgi:carboxypeptidase Taq
MMRPQAAYTELLRLLREESLLASCVALLGWDELTYMPRGGVEHRGDQLAFVAGLQHDRATDPRVGELLDIVEGSSLVHDPESPAAVNVRAIRRVHERTNRLPRSLVEEIARVTTLAQQAWLAALENATFAHFRPWLQKAVALKRREAECLAFESAYDALLDEYEPGMTGQQLAVLFDALRHELVPLAATFTHAERQPNTAILHCDYPLERQRIFGEAVAAAVGFDFHRGRLDTTAHPFFSTIGPSDCRITTRYCANRFGDGFFGILHEVGHALYEQGLDPEHHGTPMGEAVSLGMHESQSRLWENVVGRSRAFWQHFFPRARHVFHEALHDVSQQEFYFAINAVEASGNRVMADEVTYNLHILVRFELEQALLTGDLAAADLPGAWNERYRHYLGITPGNDAEGCLQDSHWAGGLIGYFPTYTLGNIFAAQLFERARADLGNLEETLARGEFGELLGWLRERIHRHGHRYPAAQLIERATGAPPDHRPLVAMLRRKYGDLYQV